MLEGKELNNLRALSCGSLRA